MLTSDATLSTVKVRFKRNLAWHTWSAEYNALVSNHEWIEQQYDWGEDTQVISIKSLARKVERQKF